MASNPEYEKANYMDASDPGIWDPAYPMPPMVRDTVDYEMMSYEPTGSDVSGKTTYQNYSNDVQSYYYPPETYIEVQYQLLVPGSTHAQASSTPGMPGAYGVTGGMQTSLCSNQWCLFQDARFLIQEQEQGSVTQKPSKMTHILNLIEKGRMWMETVGHNSGMYLDHVSDNADLQFVPTATSGGVTGLTGAIIVNQVPFVPGVSTVGKGFAGDGFLPLGMYDPVQKSAGPTGTLGVFITDVRLNPYYDPTFVTKVQRATGLTGLGQVAAYPQPQHVFLRMADLFPQLLIDKVVRGSKIEFQLNKISNVTEAVWGMVGGAGQASAQCFIDIQRIRLWMARVKPSISALSRFSKQVIESPVVYHTYENQKLYYAQFPINSLGESRYQLVYRQNRPNKIIIGFQWQVRDTDSRLNPLQFDLLGCPVANTPYGITNLNIFTNGKRVPTLNYLPQDDYTRILRDLYRLGDKEQDEAGACITYENWVNQWALFGFDLSLLEGSPYEAAAQSIIDIYWTQTYGLLGPNQQIGPNPGFNLIAVIVSEGSAVFNFSGGVSTVRTT